MKTIVTKVSILAFFLVILFTSDSCKKDEPAPKPEIINCSTFEYNGDMVSYYCPSGNWSSTISTTVARYYIICRDGCIVSVTAEDL
jgi:hypothetical protein